MLFVVLVGVLFVVCKQCTMDSQVPKNAAKVPQLKEWPVAVNSLQSEQAINDLDEKKLNESMSQVDLLQSEQARNELPENKTSEEMGQVDEIYGTTLNIEVKGILSASSASLAKAILAMDGGNDVLYRLGDIIEGSSAIVKEIRADGVLLNNGGRMEFARFWGDVLEESVLLEGSDVGGVAEDFVDVQSVESYREVIASEFQENVGGLEGAASVAQDRVIDMEAGDDSISDDLEFSLSGGVGKKDDPEDLFTNLTSQVSPYDWIRHESHLLDDGERDISSGDLGN